MILGTGELLKLVRNKKLVENLSERETINPEGAGFDLRIGELYGLGQEKGYLGIEERKTPDLKLLAKYESRKTTLYRLKPGFYYQRSSIGRD